ncbi:MAG: hypothetical protein FWH23_00405 [Bacteroidales bacterium]|nr:hypothetical protein [Bacteroidales bacterium]MCL2132774.1 hypothetical protein [Bacteroidales bacterium]
MEKKQFKLTEEHKQNAFKTPEGYFDAMQDRLTARIAVETQPQLGWWATLRPQLAFAAGFVALVIAGYGGMYLLNSINNSSSDIANDDFYAYVIDMLNVDENAVLRVLSEDAQEHPSIDADAIMNYLADASISLSDFASLD